MTPLRVVVAPDSFKGSATSEVVAREVAAGWLHRRPFDVVTTVPMADGGEGTVHALAAGLKTDNWHRLRVRGPDDRRVEGEWVMTQDRTAVVDLAMFSGIGLLSSPEPLSAHTYGFGQAIRHALGRGARRLLLGLGGSASSDGGTGALTALGARFLVDSGDDAPLGARGMSRVARADLSNLIPPPTDGAVLLTDVANQLLGRDGAARVYAPQKGASASDIESIERGFERLTQVLPADQHAPGAGAAGGAAYGLLAWGATIQPGAVAVGEALSLPRLVASHDLIITGEGCYDSQTASGKVASYVSRLARCHGRPILLVAGQIATRTESQFARTVSLTSLAGSIERAMRDPGELLREAGSRLARDAHETLHMGDGHRL